MNSNKIWRLKNPLKYACHILVASAIESGKIKREPCSECGNIKVHAHHDNYLEPFNITWLCSKHHRILHARLQGQTIGGKKRVYHYIKKEKKIKVPLFRQHPEAREMRKSGLSYSQIAKKLNISKGTAYKWVNETIYK